MKAEIIEKLQALLANDDVTAIQKEFNALSSQYRNLAKAAVVHDDHEGEMDEMDTHHEDDTHGMAPDSSSGHDLESADSQPAMSSEQSSQSEKDVVESSEPQTPIIKELSEHDKKFSELAAIFRDKLSIVREQKKRIEEETIVTAKDLLEEIQKLVSTEENIGKAFAGFNAIQEKWKSLPKVSNDAYRELNHEYNKTVERFFYNINIYKELKELDLKHNLEQKLMVLEDQKNLADQNDIRLLEVEVRLNQDRWNEIGPTFKDDWAKIKDEFWEVTKGVYKKIHDFYQVRREELDANLVKKQELLQKVDQLAKLQLKNTKKWNEKTDEIIALQNEWKMIGPMPREKGKEVAKAFRNVCDEFFKHKKSHFAEIKKVHDANKEAKEKLLSEANSLKESSDWNQAASKFKSLQSNWKNIGPAHPRDENRLWREFRSACDHFFESRKTHLGGETERQSENLELRKKLIEELKAFKTDGNRDEAINALKEFSESWRKIGHVPMAEKDAVYTLFRTALDEKYGELKLDRQTRDKLKLAEKVGALKENQGGDRLIRKERDHIRHKISRLEADIVLYENNIGFFAKSKGADKLKEEVLRKIGKAKEEINALYEQLQVFDNA
jgi:hypothetical protein